MDTASKMDMSNVVIVMVVIVIFFILMSACCRQIRQGCEEQMTLEELARRRQAFYISEASRRSLPDIDDRPTRVTTIYQDHGGLALGIYEIHMPHAHSNHRGSYPDSVISNGRSSRPSIPPPSFNSAMLNSIPISYIDPEEPPPSYDDYLKLSAAAQPEIHSLEKNNSTSSTADDKPRY